MKRLNRVFAVVLVIAVLMSMIVAPASAATYLADANGTGASSSYKSGKYYEYFSKIPLTGDQRTDTVAIALSQMGYQEGASSSALSGETGGSGNYTEYMRHTYTNGPYAWCAAFCSWALYQSGASTHNKEADMYRSHSGQSGYHWCEIYCPYWVSALKASGLYKQSAYQGGSYQPKPGDLIFFYNSSLSTVAHIGMVVYSDGSKVYTIEGNTSSGTGVEDNGGGVYYKSYSLSYSRIAGYGALNYVEDSSVADIDYSGANPTTGLYMAATNKYIYTDESCSTRATYNDGVSIYIPSYTMLEITKVSSDGSALYTTYDGVSGWLSNNSTDRVIQLTSTQSGGGSSSGGSSSGGSSSGSTTGGIHQLQGVGVPSTITYTKGIDISYFQVGGDKLNYSLVDFAALKEAGCEYVILRAGDTNLSGYIDPAFLQLYKNARAAGMPLGVYYFSRATTYAGSAAEAQWLINVMEENDMYFEYPIYIDIETDAQRQLSASAKDQLCLGWCETMEAAGYYPGIYSGTYVLFNDISSAVTNYYDLWIASYQNTTTSAAQWEYNTKDYASQGYCMWQYSCVNRDANANIVYTKGVYSSGTTATTSLDLDVCYKDYPTIMETYGYNNCGDGSAGANSNTRDNLVSDMDYNTSGTAGDPYWTDLTDGVALGYDDLWTSNAWCGWQSKGSVWFDLGETYDITGARIHLLNESSAGIIAPPSVTISVSDDGENYTTYSESFPLQSENGAYWAELNDIKGIFEGRYVKITMGYSSGWTFINEIEIYGEQRDPDGNLALGGNYTTATTGKKHDTALWQDDEIRLTDGLRSDATGTSGAYSGWSNGGTVEVVVDLGSVKDTATYKVYSASGFWGISAPGNVTVSVSTDGTNYTVVDAPAITTAVGTGDAVGSATAQLNATTVSAPETASARYVKFTIKPSGSFVWIDEVEVYSRTSGGEKCYDNLVSDMDYTITTGNGGAASDRYTANLTDGYALSYDDWYTTGAWFGFTGANTGGNYGAIVFDLGETYDITGARIHLMNADGIGVGEPSYLKISVSDDGENYTVYSEAFPVQSADGSYWAVLDDISGIFTGRYVRISFERTASWLFMNEIEIYGNQYDNNGNLALGGNYTTNSDGAVHSSSVNQDDRVRLTDGSKSNSDGGAGAYSGWVADNVEVVVDLGSVKSTGTYKLYAASNFWGISAPKHLTISVSTDGVHYTEIYAPMTSEVIGTGKAYTTSSGGTVYLQKNEITVSAATLASARYVKFTIEASGSFVWIDEVEVYAKVSGSEVCYENLLSGLDYTSSTGSTVAVGIYTDSVNDGDAMTADRAYKDGAWYAFNRAGNTNDGYADLVFDLGKVYDLSSARIHLLNESSGGALAPKSLRIWSSLDGKTYTDYADFPLQSANGCYWAELDSLSLSGRYVKITCQIADGKNWAMLNEIEVYGTAVDPNANLALGGDYTTSTTGAKHGIASFQDDEIRLTNGSGSNADGGSSAYSGWEADAVTVLVDLGKSKATGTYVVYSASGFWGISAPGNVTVYVSADGESYSQIDAPVVTKRVGANTDGGGLWSHTVASEYLVSARYVKFCIEASGKFIWIDEVEVYAKTAKTVIVTMDSHTVYEDEGMPELSYKVTDADGNTLTVSGLTVTPVCAGTTDTAGTYTITAEVSDVSGYLIKVVDGKLTVQVKNHTAGDPVEENRVEATCEANGSYDSVVYCTECKEEISRQTVVIPAIGHSWEKGTVTAPTCTEQGYTTYTCSGCEDSYAGDYVDATGHSYGQWTENTAATCTEAGEERRECANCDAYETRPIEAVGHTEGETVEEPQKEATCGESGYYDSVVYCSVCNAELSSTPVTIPATGQHSGGTATCKEAASCETCGQSYGAVDPSNHAGRTETRDAKAAACEETGYSGDTYCLDCGAKIKSGATIPAIGHSWDAGKVTTEPTCTETGVMTYTCQNDAAHTKTEAVPANGHRDENNNFVCDVCEKNLCDPHNYESVVTDPTCTAAGYTTHTCSACGDSYVDNYADALGHSYESVVTDPTCTEEGYTTHTCSVCGSSYVSDYTSATGHSYEGVVTAPTCAELGYTTYTCSGCGDSYKDSYVAAKGHTWGQWEVTEKPTCTEKGKETLECADCDVIETREAAATGHDWDEGEVTTEPTCTRTGVMTYTCQNDTSHTKTEVVPANGHTDADENYVCDVCGEELCNHSYESVVTAPTCTEQGYTTRTCSSCKHSYVDDYVDATGHSYGEWTETTAATCTEAGEETRACTCGYAETRAVKAKGHSYESVVADPTCTEQGYTTHTCSACGNSYVSGYVDAVGHDWGEWDVTTQPTCTAEGVERRDCGACDAYETQPVAATGHDYDDGVVTTEPGCTTEGEMTYTCRNDKSHTYTEAIAAVGHKDENGDYTCDVCNAELCTDHQYASVVTAPTCTEQGYTTRTCSSCKHSYVDDYVDATGHSYSQWTETKAATCTEAGEERRNCGSCDHYETRETEAKGHSHERAVTVPTCVELGYTTYTCACGDSYVSDYTNATGHSYEGVVTAPTCTEQGYTTYTCSACGGSYVDDYEPVTDHKYGDWRVTKEATCTETGEETRTCTCGDAETRAVKAKGHSYESDVTAPTCTEQGFTTYTCTRDGCKYSYVDDYVDATGHSWGDWKETAAPTCTLAGEEARTCGGCGQTQTRKVEATGHSYDSVVVEPTCTKRGYTTYTCSECGDSYEDDYKSALGHSYDSVVTEPTCTKRGYTTYTCSDCGDSYEDDYKSALGHSYDSVVTEPTCTEAGYTTHTCSACGDSYKDDYKSAVGHSYNSVVTAPTCTEQGYTTYTCACGDSYVDDEVDAVGHDWDEGVVTTEPTETEDGEMTYTCGTCGETRTEAVPALGHSHDYTAVVTDPTCTEKGYTTYTCSVCKHSYVDDYVDATGHSWGDWKETAAPTCTMAGEEAQTCGGCGQTQTRKVEATGHSYEGVVTEPTCTKRGYTTYTCSECGDSYEDDYKSARGHSYDSVVTEPACTEAGYTTHTCSACGDSYQDDYKSAVGHSWGEGSVTAPTCTEQGCTTYTCATCGDSYTSDYVAANGHNWDQGVITIQPTESSSGVKTYTCQTCDETKTEKVPALEHSHEYSEKWESDKNGHWQECSCGDKTEVEDHVSGGPATEDQAETCTECGYEIAPKLGRQIVFDWNDDYTCEAVCDEDAGNKACTVTCAISTEGELTVMTVTASIILDGVEYTDSLTITGTISDGVVTVELPEELGRDNMFIVIAAFDDSGRMVEGKMVNAPAQTITETISGDNVQVFFLNAAIYSPLLSSLWISK